MGPPATPQRYRIQKKLGQGGFGAAYLGEDFQEGRPCVLKEVIRNPSFSPTEQQRMVEGEASLLATLQHPGLPRVWDAFERDGLNYLVMEFVDGLSLERLATDAGGRVPEADALRACRDIAQVLGYLHAQSPPVIHRDISPDNIVRRPGGDHALLDFGAARLFDASKTKDTITIGKLGYHAPEAMTGQSDARSDLYSLGATLYRLCLDYDPSSKPFSFPTLTGAGLTASFIAVMERLVQQKAANRFQSAQELLLALESLEAPTRSCASCGRPVPEGAWRCPGGHSLLPAVAWPAAGGGGSRTGRVADAWPDRKIAWQVDLGQATVGGAVGADATAILALLPAGVAALDIGTGQVKWVRAMPSGYETMSGPALMDGKVVLAFAQELWAFDVRTGLPSRLCRLDAPGPYSTTPMGNRLHVVSHDGARWTASITDGTAQRLPDLGYDCRHGPVIVGDRVVFGGVLGEVTGYSMTAGRDLWAHQAADRCSGGILAAGRSIIAAGTSGHVTALDVDTGAELGGADVEDQVYAPAAATGTSVVVAGRTSVSVIDVTTWQVARHPLDDAMRVAGPVLLGHTLLSADMVTGRLLATDAATGRVRVVGETGAKVTGWLAYIDGIVVATSASGAVVGVGPK